MNIYNFFVAFAIALIATACASPSGYGAPDAAADYAQASSSNAAASAGPAPAAADGSYGAAAPSSYGGSSYGNSYGPQAIPYSSQNLRGNTVTSSISYPHNRGEILIHRPAAIIVKRPPTKVLVNHPPLVVKPAPVVLHKPPAVVLRRVLVKHHPRPVRVEPVYVNVVKPPAEKYFVNERQQSSAPASYSPASAPSYSNDNAAANGYQLVNSNQGLASLASLAGSNAAYAAPSAAPYAAPSAAPYAPAPAY